MQLAPLDVFPIQQVLIRYPIPTHINPTSGSTYKCTPAAERILKPERFAAGFLLFLRSLSITQVDECNQDALVFALSSAPSSLSDDPLLSVEISPTLSKSFAANSKIGPRMRDMVPGSWTAVVSLDMWKGSAWLFYIRYAFIRTVNRRVVVSGSSGHHLDLDDFKVVDLKEFLALTAP